MGHTPINNWEHERDHRTTYGETTDGIPCCVYCAGAVGCTDAVPRADDDAAWDALARDHEPGCEWIATRAHRREV